MSTTYATGDYWGQITDYGWTESSKKKTPQIFVRFNVMGGVLSDDPDKMVPVEQVYERTMYRPATDNTMEYLLNDLETLGFQNEHLTNFDARKDASLLETYAKFRCKHEEYPQGSGQFHERWELAFVGKPVERADENQVRRLEALFGKAWQDRRRGKATPASEPMNHEEIKQETTQALAEDASDIPF